jgi:hypothetical protein
VVVVVLVPGPVRVNGAAVMMIGCGVVRVFVDERRAQGSGLKRN